MIELIIAWLAGAYAGWVVSKIVFKANLRDALEELGVDTDTKRKELREKALDFLRNEEEDDEDDLPVYQLRIEQHDGIYFLYDDEDGQFMAQGADFHELVDKLRSRFKAAKYTVSGDQAAVLRELLQKNNISLSSPKNG
jgi:hypothetical protein